MNEIAFMPTKLRTGPPMQRITLPYLWQISEALAPVEQLKFGNYKYKDIFWTAVNASTNVEALHSTSVFAPYLRVSYAPAQALLNLLKRVNRDHEMERDVWGFEISEIKSSASQYKIALLAEFASLDTYLVTRKAPFDTLTLLQWGESLFPSDLPSKVNEAVVDAREAGKCLAYEVSTAAGFHTFRATESVLRKYYHYVTGGAAPPKVRSINVYVNAMRIAKVGDEKILACLKQMADLHRNPLIHPEVVLTIDEAIATLGIARSAITAMLAVLPVQPLTVASAQFSALPGS